MALKQNRLISLSSIVLLTCILYSEDAPAPPPGGPTSPPINIACDTTTDYTFANLNEIKSKGGASNPSVEFVEVKILADNTDISGWEICFSDNPNKEDCTELGTGDGTWYFGGNNGSDDNSPDGNTEYDNGAYLVYDAKNVKADAGEVLLRSSVGGESGAIVLDYIRYDNTPGICGDGNERWNITDDNGGTGLDITASGSEPDDYTACSACFDSRDPNQKDFARSEPDGTGDWGNNGDAPSEGSTNDSGGTSGSFNITFNAAPGSTCSADSSLDLREPISITVLNNGGNPLTNFDGVIVLTTDTGHGSWYTTDGDGGFSLDPPQGAGALTDTTLDDGQAIYDFDAADDGTITLYLANEHAETVQVTVTDQSDPGVFSSLGGLSFSDNIFVISVVEPNAPFNTSPDNLIPVAGRPHALQIEMMRRDTTVPLGDCGPASNYTESSIKAWYTTGVNHPAGATAPSLDATTLTTTEPSDPDPDNLSISFTSGVATFNLNTTDVGQFTLHFKDDLGSFITNDIVSDPISFTVRPFGFDIQVTANPAATDHNGASFTKAGEDFEVAVRALQWDSGDDDGDVGGNAVGIADDGIPDGHEAADNDPANNTPLNDNASVTSSFGNEVSAEAISLSALLNQPSGGNDPGLTGSTTISSFVSGSGNTNTVQFNEVGIIEITAEVDDTDYLDIGFATTQKIIGKSGYVGRFYPDRFNVALQAVPLNVPAFNDSCSGFTYQDQPFYYSTSPVLEITALSSNGNVTENYGGSFWKLTGSNLNRDYTDGSAVAPNASFNPNMTVTGGFTIAGETDFDGIATFSLISGSSGDSFSYEKGLPEAEFAADVDVTFQAIGFQDTDHTAMNPVCYDATNDGTCDDFTHAMIQGTDLRWGRMILNNAFGSELLAIEVPLNVEYYNTDGFEINTADTCTTYDSLDMSFVMGSEEGVMLGDLSLTGSGTTVSGRDDPANSILATNTNNDIGSADVTINLSAQDWLQFDWDDLDMMADGPYDGNPTSRITWGIFSGPDEFIYIREAW
jgi:MSHA biogenesis protein MshQ